jgi:hypothetical protein
VNVDEVAFACLVSKLGQRLDERHALNITNSATLASDVRNPASADDAMAESKRTNSTTQAKLIRH